MGTITPHILIQDRTEIIENRKSARLRYENQMLKLAQHYRRKKMLNKTVIDNTSTLPKEDLESLGGVFTEENHDSIYFTTNKTK